MAPNLSLTIMVEAGPNGDKITWHSHGYHSMLGQLILSGEIEVAHIISVGTTREWWQLVWTEIEALL